MVSPLPDLEHVYRQSFLIHVCGIYVTLVSFAVNVIGIPSEDPLTLSCDDFGSSQVRALLLPLTKFIFYRFLFYVLSTNLPISYVKPYNLFSHCIKLPHIKLTFFAQARCLSRQKKPTRSSLLSSRTRRGRSALKASKMHAGQRTLV